MQPELLTHYKDNVVPSLKEKLSVKNIHEVPRIEKIVVTSCVGSQADRSQALEDATEEISRITGQKPITIHSKKAVSNFRLRAGEAIATKVTLRNRHMYEFLQRFMKTAIPRIRDFRGINPKSFDGNGNYTMGISDQTIFPEIELDQIKRNIGFDISIVTSAVDDNSARELLAQMGMPFRKPKEKEEETLTQPEPEEVTEETETTEGAGEATA